MTRCIMETLRLWPALVNGTARELVDDDFIIGKVAKNQSSKGTYIRQLVKTS